MHVSEYPAGTRFAAGLGVATVLPDADFETYSEAGYIWNEAAGKWDGPPNAAQGKKGLGVVGAALYATHPSTEVLKLAYNLKDGRGKRRWQPGQPLPVDLIDHVMRGGLIEAWNSAFEWWIWNYVCVPKYGFPQLSYTQLRCAMAKARASCYPGKLGLAGDVMRLEVRKDKRGDALLKKYSTPRTPTKGDPSRRWNLAANAADDIAMTEYNETDIMTEAEASARCPDLEGEELEFWLVDQLINRRGVAVDAAALADCAAMVNLCLERFNAELCELTGGVVERASQLERLKGWLAGQGVHLRDGKGSADEEAIEEEIAKLDKHLADKPEDGPGWLLPCRRALELRQLVGSASVKKVFAMTNTLSPWGRLHDLFNYHGARTGRPTGEGPQPTNLPKAGPKVYRCLCGRHHGTHLDMCPWCGLPAPVRKPAEWGPDGVDDVLTVIKTRNLDVVRHVFGDALLAVSGCLRGLFVAAEGHDLICSDFSSIEGVVTAALAGEQWRMDMFATHGKAYELSVSKITGIPFADIMAHAGYDDVSMPEWWKHRARKGEHHPMRQTIGKVAELASGFGGWIGAWKRFGADEFMDDEAIKKAILAWRAASPEIVEFWGGQVRDPFGRCIPELFGLEGMAIAAVLEPGKRFPVMRRDGTHTGCAYIMHGDALYCELPSGRYLTYHRPRLTPNAAREQWKGAYSFSYEGYNTNPLAGAIGWVTMYAYGGKFCENVVQATARDIQRFAILNLERAGYHVVLHVYDEDVCEVPQDWGSIEEMERIMSTMPAWATYRGQPWPIKANGGWRGRRYRKA